jgi:hypothetical protein
MRIVGRLTLLAASIACVSAFVSSETYATQPCTFTTKAKSKVMKLDADCSTTGPILIPEKFTLDGQGHTITAVDPPSDHFHSAIVQNAGAVAHVRNVTLTASNLADVCDTGDDKLRGILFDGASGSITKTTITDVNKSGQGDCAAQGASILVRNAPFDETHPKPEQHVHITHSTITGFSKIGIAANGNLTAQIAHCTVQGLSGTGIAVDGEDAIVIEQGALGGASHNTITQTWNSGDPETLGIFVFESDKVHVGGNTINGSKEGIFQESFCESAPSASRGVISGNQVHAVNEGIVLVARSQGGMSNCDAHVDRNHVQGNTIVAPAGVTGESGIFVGAQVLGGGTNTPTADRNVIQRNTIGGYTNAIFQSGDTNTVIKKNTILP